MKIDSPGRGGGIYKQKREHVWQFQQTMLLMGTWYTANNTGDVLLQVFRLNSRFLCGSVPYLQKWAGGGVFLFWTLGGFNWLCCDIRISLAELSLEVLSILAWLSSQVFVMLIPGCLFKSYFRVSALWLAVLYRHFFLVFFFLHVCACVCVCVSLCASVCMYKICVYVCARPRMRSCAGMRDYLLFLN